MAYVLIVLAVIVYALYPSALLQFVSEKIDIFSYLIVFQLVAATSRVSMAAYYVQRVQVPSSSEKPRIVDPLIVNRQTIQIGLLNAILGNLAFGCFFFALFYGSVVRASVFYELWASIFLLLTMYLRRNQPGEYEHRHGKVNTFVFFVLGALGVILVVSSHSPPGSVSKSGSDVFDILVVIAAVASPILMALSFFVGTKNARIISIQLKNAFGSHGDVGETQIDRQMDILAGVYHGVFARVLGSILLLSLAFVLYALDLWKPKIEITNNLFVFGFILCALMSAFGGALADISNNISKTSNLNLFWSFTPFFAVIFLNVFGFSDDTSKQLYYGAILILASNYILLSRNTYSNSFIISIFLLCTIYYLILFVPPLQYTTNILHISVPLGIFGIFAAFFVDRIMRNFEKSKSNISVSEPEADDLIKSGTLFTHNVFILWILGFGSVFGIMLFRPENSMAIDFVTAFVSVAVIYICLLPIEYLMQSGKSDVYVVVDDHALKINMVVSLAMSALFIGFLFVLFLFALIQKT